MTTNAAVQELTQLLDETHQPDIPMRPHQVREFREERDRLREIVTAPSYVTGANRATANLRYRQIDKMLHDQAPRAIESVEVRDRVYRIAKTVLNDTIKPALVPQEVLRRNPAGAVDAFLRQENSPATQHAVKQWKRAQWALEPEADTPNWSNIEIHRPSLTGMPGWASTFMADAQIPGVFAMSPQAKANWPLGEPSGTPLAQAKARELSSARATQQRRAELGSNPEHNKAWGQNMARIRAEKRQARAAAAAPPPGEP